ncbi:flavonoid 3-O-glucosyltransferase-like [Senna tora]|uniref:Glycosyltransferase n=1 Tax=Senna tora TaxID=362788 RepID=A0A834XHM1_9FABA|nr:flavonoid 3-O-glucosyltransferase-like [Senna tora]
MGGFEDSNNDDNSNNNASSSSSSSLHVAVLAFPFGTHAGPLLSLVEKIADSAPNVTFSFFSTARSIDKVFSNKRIPNVRPRIVHDGLPKGFRPSSPMEPINLFLKETPENYRRAMEEAVEEENGKKITCLVSDAFYWFCADMAEEMQAKWIPVWTSGPHSLLAHLSTDILRWRLSWNGGKKDRTLNFIPGLSDANFSDLPREIASEEEMEAPFAAMMHKMSQMLPRATALAINSFDAVFPTIVKELESKFKLLLLVGPFPITTKPKPPLRVRVKITAENPDSDPISPDSTGCLKWLDQQEDASVAYISFGSFMTPPPHELAALADAIEESGFPFIWSFRGDPETELPFAFLKRTKNKGKVVPWAPQSHILKHRAVGVFVTHCGWNSIMESVVGGVPMICRPFFGDQMLNTRMLEKAWGIGVGVESGEFTRKGTLKVLEMVLASEKGNVMRQKVVELQYSAMEADKPYGNSTQNFKTLIDLVTK